MIQIGVKSKASYEDVLRRAKGKAKRNREKDFFGRSCNKTREIILLRTNSIMKKITTTSSRNFNCDEITFAASLGGKVSSFNELFVPPNVRPWHAEHGKSN